MASHFGGLPVLYASFITRMSYLPGCCYEKAPPNKIPQGTLSQPWKLPEPLHRACSEGSLSISMGKWPVLAKRLRFTRSVTSAQSRVVAHCLSRTQTLPTAPVPVFASVRNHLHLGSLGQDRIGKGVLRWVKAPGVWLHRRACQELAKSYMGSNQNHRQWGKYMATTVVASFRLSSRLLPYTLGGGSH